MRMRDAISRIAVCLVSAALILCFIPGEAKAQVKKLDHFKCYLADAPGLPGQATLEDQFDRAMGMLPSNST